MKLGLIQLVKIEVPNDEMYKKSCEIIMSVFDAQDENLSKLNDRFQDLILQQNLLQDMSQMVVGLLQKVQF